jgi:outer membrane protein assembly factor BamB
MAAIAIAFDTIAASGSDRWPQFRGPQAGVAVDDPALPDTWSPTRNVAWKLPVPGSGWSSPVVWGDHIFITSVVSEGEVELPKLGLYSSGERPTPTETHRWMVYDIDFRTGRIRWAREAHHAIPRGPKHVKNTYATETPVTDGERVYAYFGNVGVFVFDFAGKPLWSTEFDAVSLRSGWGTAASPVLYGDRLIIVNDNDSQSFITAFDKRTGRPLWRVNREEGTNWSTPFVWEHDRDVEIVTSGTRGVRSYDVDGQLRWQLKGMSSITAPTPFAKQGLLYVMSGFPGDGLRPVYAIRPGATGDISLKEDETSNNHVAWSNRLLGTYITTPLVYGDFYYTLLDRGLFLCHDAKTGHQVYGRQRLTAGGFTASMWAYNGKIFALSEEGDTYVIQAGPEFKVLGKNPLDEITLATPAVAQGSVIIRTLSKLYRIAKADAS